MFGMGMPEILLILGIALIVIGPKKLPDLAKSLGKAVREFKGATQEFKNSMDVKDTIDTVKNPLNNISDNVKDAISVNNSLNSVDTTITKSTNQIKNDTIKKDPI